MYSNITEVSVNTSDIALALSILGGVATLPQAIYEVKMFHEDMEYLYP